jgi:hypothetical protein
VSVWPGHGGNFQDCLLAVFPQGGLLLKFLTSAGIGFLEQVYFMRGLFSVITVINLIVHKNFSIDASLYAHFVFGAFDQDHNGVINFEV